MKSSERSGKARRTEYHRLYQRNRRSRSYAEFLERDQNEWIFRVRTEQRRKIARATPEWADRSDITAIYRHCAEMNRASGSSGLRYKVIHEIPVLGRQKKICGLHVPWNLRIVRDR